MYSVLVVCVAISAVVADTAGFSRADHGVYDDCTTHPENGGASCSVALLQMNARVMNKKAYEVQSVIEDGDRGNPGWTYGDLQQWASAFPDCSGLKQSPIDITANPDSVELSDSGTSTMFDHASYNPIPPQFGLEMVNNGHNLKINGGFGELLLPDGIYEAKQLRFHFPSEHSVFGELADGEMHIVHQRQGATGTAGLAIVAVLLTEAGDTGFSQRALHERAFFRKIGLSAGVRPGLPFQITETVDIAEVFAGPLGGGFYHYEGSLTTPPCSETVHWYVLKEEASVSQRQIETFKTLFPAPANNRPVQPLNSRVIVEGQLAADPAEFVGPAASGEGDQSSDHPKDVTRWGYDNTDVWSKVYPDCVGQSQSPIDISSFLQNPIVQLSALVSYDVVNGPFKIFNNGHSVQMNGNFGTLQLPNGEYEMRQFHFHFPSEHKVDGKLATGEMQIVHQLKGATGTDDLAIISIMLQDVMELGRTPRTAREVSFFESLGFVGQLPPAEQERILPASLAIDLTSTFAFQLAGSFYHYEGSLTTPPCSETVHWYVLQTPAAVNVEMVRTFKALFPSPANSRPVQPVNNRQVAEDKLNVADDFAPKSGKYHWGYGEPDRWSSLYPDCAGPAQSPININEKAIGGFHAGEYAAPEPLSEFTYYKPVKGLALVNNGRTIQVNGNFGELRLPDGVYEAKQFHFHFPSEHALFGKLSEGEMHIVHQRQGAHGTQGLAIIAIMLADAHDLGWTSPTLSQIELFRTMKLPEILPEQGKQYELPSDYTLDLGAVFAEELADPYFHYQGSLDAPPCSETVRWFVLENPAAVTRPIINRFKEMFPSPSNNRPLQQLNGRSVAPSRLAVNDEEY